MRYAVIVVGLIVAVIAIIVIVGSTLPVKHTVARQAAFHATPTQLFDLIRNVSDYPTWQKDVTKVEILPDSNGKPRIRETNGGQAITYELDEIVPNQRIVSRIADSNLPFGGRWTYELDQKGDATMLRITENGEVYNVIYRFVSAYLMGHAATIDKYLEAVSTRFPMVSPVA
jgi:hypothetical protein